MGHLQPCEYLPPADWQLGIFLSAPMVFCYSTVPFRFNALPSAPVEVRPFKE